MISGIFPASWKHALITPKPDASSILNYRLTSVLISASKIFERIVHSNINFCTQYLISKNQHGFTKGKSTTTNLLYFLSTVGPGVSNQGQVDFVYFDFQKVFEIIHRVLLKRLPILGLGEIIVARISSF